jgi:putative membrane protein
MLDVAMSAVTPHDVWRTWAASPAVLAGLGVAAWAYGRGVRSLWQAGGMGRGVRPWQAAAFGAGLLAVAAALVSPVDAAADHLLSVHMAQHLLLVVVAAPLLIMGSPVLAMSRVLPEGWRRATRQWGRRGFIRVARRTISNPAGSLFLATAVLWAWHVPSLYEAAVQNPILHVVEHASFLGTALLFWWVALQPSGPRRLSRGVDVLYVFAGALQSGALGALLTFASSPIYPLYAHRTAAWGASPIADQQLAGLLMWVPSFVVYLLAAGALFVAWLRASEREARRADARAEPLLATFPSEASRRV